MYMVSFGDYKECVFIHETQYLGADICFYLRSGREFMSCCGGPGPLLSPY